jgi:hypothetical protein
MARWEWLAGFMASHRYISAFVHTPFVYLALLILGFAFLTAERRLKMPNLLGRFVNSQIIPDLHSVTLKDVFDSDSKKPGWDEIKLNWVWFIEVQFVNDSDTRTTIDHIEVEVSTGKRNEQSRLFEDSGKFKVDMAYDNRSEPKAYQGERYRNLPSLMQVIKDVPLERGIGYRGWLRVGVKQVNQKDMNGGEIKMDVWLVDALQGRHKVNFKKKSDKTWDTSFLIFEDNLT